MLTCINLDLDLSQIGLPKAAIEHENMSFTYNGKMVSLAMIRPFSYLQVMRRKSNRKGMNKNWSNKKANPTLKTKTGNK